MSRKSFAQKLFVLTPITIICLLFVYFFYYKFKIAQNNHAEYKLAISCPNKDNCREKHEAIILESHAVITHIIRISRTGNKTPPSINSVYVLEINSPVLGNRTIEISANPPSVGTPFDIGNVQIPPDTGTKFVQENLPAGKTVYVETWHGQIIFLYVDEIIDLPRVNYEPIPLLEKPEQPTFLKPSPPKIYEIALPTSNHPIFLHAIAQNNLFSVCLLSAIFIGATLIFTFKKK